MIAHRRLLAVLGALFAAWWLVLAIDPVDRAAWLLENAAALAGVAVMVALHRRFVFSRPSYVLVFVFLCLHLVGAHYTYSLVPYDAWFAALTGRTLADLLGWERNNYDRILHFAYGLCLAFPIRELFLRVVAVRGFWGYFLPLDLTMSSSMLFELLEWAVAAAFGDGLGQAYLATQGDEWDAHRDMALASLGALITMVCTALVNWRRQRGFAREWAESLRIKHKVPIDEAAAGRARRRAR